MPPPQGPCLGLDFGTTNSAIALLGEDGSPQLATFDSDTGPTTTFRSVLYFDRDEEDESTSVHAGPRAISRYFQSEEKDGRLIQSLKSFLASRLFSATNVFGRAYRLEDLIGLLVGSLREQAERSFGQPVERAVVGRPVHFVGAEDDSAGELALRRLRAALHNAGLRQVDFEYEPIGAAYHYERGLEHDELILIADFGGGTSDFSLLRVGPGVAQTQRAERILGYDGVGIAGDAFDGRIVRHLVGPLLGRGTRFRSIYDRELPVPSWIYAHLERWHHVSFLKSRKTMQLLLDLRREAVEPDKLDALIRLVESDLGFLLYQATERTKRALSQLEATRFRFDHDLLQIDEPVERAQFEAWIGDELERIAECVDRLLSRTGLERSAVDRVFMTGGSSFVPSVRRIFTDRFGEERIRSGGELTSVANGLALRAAD